MIPGVISVSLLHTFATTCLFIIWTCHSHMVSCIWLPLLVDCRITSLWVQHVGGSLCLFELFACLPCPFDVWDALTTTKQFFTSMRSFGYPQIATAISTLGLGLLPIPRVCPIVILI